MFASAISKGFSDTIIRPTLSSTFLEIPSTPRYSAKEDKATIEMVGDDLIKVCFEKPTARVTPGQSAVFYIGDIVLGGGKII